MINWALVWGASQMLWKDKDFVIPKALNVDVIIIISPAMMQPRGAWYEAEKHSNTCRSEIFVSQRCTIFIDFSLFALNDQFLLKKLSQRRQGKQRLDEKIITYSIWSWMIHEASTMCWTWTECEGLIQWPNNNKRKKQLAYMFCRVEHGHYQNVKMPLFWI